MTEGASGEEPSVWSWASKRGRQIVSGWLVVGGLWGLGRSIWSESSLELGSGLHASLGVPVLAVVVFVVCTASGVLFWLREVAGGLLARIMLSAQLIEFRVGDVEYLCGLNAGLFFGVDRSDLVFNGRLGSFFAVAFSGPPQEFALLLNVVPLVLLVLLLDGRRDGSRA